MLQIVSKKFFESSELHETVHRSVFFTNYSSLHSNIIQTSLGKILPSSSSIKPSTLTFELVEFQEANVDGRPGVLMSTLGKEFTEDFTIVISFVLNICITKDVGDLRRLTGDDGYNYRSSQRLIKGMFDKEIQRETEDDIKIDEFLSSLIALKRDAFEAVMRALRRFITACRLAGDEPSLAYTLFVMSM